MDTITFTLEPSDDEELTCVLCSCRNCNLEFRLPGGAATTWHGAHRACVDELRQRMAREGRRDGR